MFNVLSTLSEKRIVAIVNACFQTKKRKEKKNGVEEGNKERMMTISNGK